MRPAEQTAREGALVLLDAGLRGSPIHTAFHPRLPVKIGIHEYLRCVEGRLSLSHDELVLALMYMEDFANVCEISFPPEALHRLLLVALYLAHVWLQDRCVAKSRFAAAGGLPSWDFSRLCELFLRVVDYRLLRSYSAFLRFERALAEQGLARGRVSTRI